MLVNAGVDTNVEDNFGNIPQYYMDHQGEIKLPEWQPKWTLQPIESPSPRPSRKNTKEKSAAPRSPTKGKRDGD